MLPRMKRDAGAPGLAVILLVPALPVAGLVHASLLPAAPAAYYPVALGLCVLYFLAVAPVRRQAAWRVGLGALAALPFLFFAVLEGGAGERPVGLPGPGWFAALLVAAGAGFALRRRAALPALLVVLLGGGAVLSAADLPLLPAGWNPVRQPLEPVADALGGRPLHEDAAAHGVRAAAPVRLPAGRVPALGAGPGPWWVRAAEGSHPGPRPVVLVLDGAARPGSVRPEGEMTLVHASEVDFRHVLDLVAFDVILLREGAWREDDADARQKATAVARFVRGGGLLIGPAPHRPWPPHLARRLRARAEPAEAGVEGIRRLGLGRIARANTREDAEAVLAARAWVPEVETPLGREAAPPIAPAGLEGWRDRPEGRRAQGALLLVYVLVLFALVWLLRGASRQLLGVLLTSAAVCVGLLWLSPRDPGYRVHGVVLELGERGGRRYEALYVSAGPRGFREHVHWVGGGVVSLHGGRLEADGRVRIAPGRAAWIARETVGAGLADRDTEDRFSAFLRPLLRGSPAPERLRYGRIPALPVHVPGLGAIPAATLRYRPPD